MRVFKRRCVRARRAEEDRRSDRIAVVVGNRAQISRLRRRLHAVDGVGVRSRINAAAKTIQLPVELRQVLPADIVPEGALCRIVGTGTPFIVIADKIRNDGRVADNIRRNEERLGRSAKGRVTSGLRVARQRRRRKDRLIEAHRILRNERRRIHVVDTGQTGSRLKGDGIAGIKSGDRQANALHHFAAGIRVRADRRSGCGNAGIVSGEKEVEVTADEAVRLDQLNFCLRDGKRRIPRGKAGSKRLTGLDTGIVEGKRAGKSDLYVIGAGVLRRSARGFRAVRRGGLV